MYRAKADEGDWMAEGFDLGICLKAWLGVLKHTAVGRMQSIVRNGVNILKSESL